MSAKFPLDTGRLRRVIEIAADQAGWAKKKPAKKAAKKKAAKKPAKKAKKKAAKKKSRRR